MSRYDGLIIPRSYSEYINKTDAATLLQALQQSGVMDAAPTGGSNHPAKSGGIAAELAGKQNIVDYSTSELNTGRKWTDGKVVYQKTFVGSITTERIVLSNAIPAGATVIKIDGVIQNQDGVNFDINYFHTETGYTFSSYCYVANTQVVIDPFISTSYEGYFNNSTYRVTIEYTKSN